LYPAASVVRSWSRWRGRATGRAGTDVSLPIRPVNDALRAIFAAESRVLIDLLRRRRPRGYAHGLSLIAMLRRDQGWIDVSARPDDVGPDPYDPTTGRRQFESRYRTKRDTWG